MITHETVDRIMNAALIEEVVGDFVHLKKRGTSLIGLCPFHNEKTPSFHVSVVKGIYKCFGCGKGGNPINFVMDHEKYSYPEALRYLANKYNIAIEETEKPEEELQQQEAKESLFVVSTFAQKYFSEVLWENEEGKSIGLSYFKERGFREEIIQKFQLGYSLQAWDGLTTEALKNGYNQEYLEKTGLSIKNELGKVYDRFRGRVMFPIHNLTGRVIGFGGRILKADPKSAKYVNSPESEIYHKSQSLYGIFFAKKAIRDEDSCFLVEGYTDVISLHQAGIENVVASSGTSLTQEQIRLIARFTTNITILYDGDAAGIKASLRGIDMILEEGLNVKIVLFPDGHDPDSYSRQVGGKAFRDYIEDNKKDFILFKTSLLLDDVQGDPIKKAGLIHEIVESIALIPDSIKVSLFIKECSRLLDMEERVLLSELNKLRLKKAKSAKSNTESLEQIPESIIEEEPIKQNLNDDAQEQEIIRLLFNYAPELIAEDLNVVKKLVSDLDEVSFSNPLFAKIMSIYKAEWALGNIPPSSFFTGHIDQEISQLAVSLLSNNYTLSDNWKTKHGIFVPIETELLRFAVETAGYHLKLRKLDRMITENNEKLREAKSEEEETRIQRINMHLNKVKVELSKAIGAVILKS